MYHPDKLLEKEKLIVQLRKNGRTINEIKSEVRCGLPTISNALMKNGIRYYQNTGEDFFKSISINSNSSCWEWKGYLNKDGYGKFYLNSGAWFAHRFSYILFKGDPADSHVLHTCDNRKCVNPAHLFLGTHDDNMKDMAHKGRDRITHKAKLHPQQIFEIRESLKNGESIRALANKYNVSVRTLRCIKEGRNWKKLTQETFDMPCYQNFYS